ncbi:MAG: ATPase P [Desulfovibrionaceae bacterium]
MLKMDIPGFGPLQLDKLVLDFNGTLAQDGALLPGVAGILRRLAPLLELYVVTADTHGTCAHILAGLPVQLAVLGPGAEDQAKLDHVRRLDPRTCAAVGNGRNDALMLAECALGVAVCQGECAAAQALAAADIVAPDILSALGLFIKPKRLEASLRY